MNKIVKILIGLLMMISLCACSSSKSDAASFATFADAYGAGDEYKQEAYTETYYVYVFKYQDTYYRASMKMTDELYKQLEAVDFFDEQREQKHHDIVGPMEIEKLENLTEAIPSQDEMDQWVGKTGQELLDAGFMISGWFLETQTEYLMDYGDYEYSVVFNEKVEYNEDNFDGEEAVKPLTVKSVTFSTLSNGCTDIETE